MSKLHNIYTQDNGKYLKYFQKMGRSKDIHMLNNGK